MAKVYATGRRKTAIAKVWLESGNGQLTINGMSLDAWLGGHEAIKKVVMQPLELSKQTESVNVVVKNTWRWLCCTSGSCKTRYHKSISSI